MNGTLARAVDQAWKTPEDPELPDLLDRLVHEHAGDSDLHARCHLARAHIYATNTKQYVEAGEWVDRGLALGRDTMTLDTWLRLLNYSGFLMLVQGRYAEAVEPLVAALRGGRQAELPKAMGFASTNLAEALLVLGDAEAALRALERVQYLEPSLLIEREWVWVRALVQVGRLDEARAVATRAEGLDADTLRRQHVRQCITAERARVDGRWHDVVRALDGGVVEGMRATLTACERVVPIRLLAEAHMHNGDLEEAARWCAAGVYSLPGHGSFQEAHLLRVAADVARARGETEKAFSYLEQALDLTTQLSKGIASGSILSFADRHLDEIEQRDVDLATVNEGLRRSRRTAEAALARAEAAHARLVTITDSLPIQIGHVDANHVVRFANATMVSVWASKGHDIVGADLRVLLDDAAHRTFLAGYESGMAGSPFTSVEQVPAGDSVRFVEATWIPAHPSDTGVYLVASDVTDRHEQVRLERQLQGTQRLESLGVLASAIAHHFNNLLTGLTANIGVVEERLDDPFASEALQDALAASNRAAELTRQLFAFTGLARIRSEPSELNMLVRDAVDLARAGLDKRAVLHVELCNHPLPIVGESGQIAQVCLNLLVNASEALEGGHGEVWIRTGRWEHDGSELVGAHPDGTLPEGTYVWFEVQDTGSGVDGSTLRRVFEPFYTTKETGRGLGLAACLGIVRSHQGRILLASEAGRGSAFRVLLPLVDVRGSVEPGLVTRDPAARGRVLVVDDDEHVRRAMSRILASGGWEVHLAPDGREGLRMLREVDPDIVFLDLTMPVMDGAQTLRGIRSVSDVPVVLISGYTQSEASSLLGVGGAQGFLQKPLGVRGVLDVAARTAQVSTGKPAR